MTLVPLPDLLAGGRADGHVIAVRGRDYLTLDRLRAEVAHNARRIAVRGARRGMLVCTDSFQFVVGILALLCADADVILPPNAQPGTLASLSDAYDILVTDEPPGNVANAMVLENVGAASQSSLPDFSGRRIDCFTSGSSGRPKRVEKTLAMFESEAGALEAIWGERIGPAHVTGTVGHQHIYGLTFRIMWPLLAGRSLCALVNYVWENLIAELPPDAVIISSPAHLTRLDGLPELPAARQPRMIFSAGAPLPAPAAGMAARLFGVAPTEIFGSTETGAVAYRAGSDDPPLWQPLPGVTVAAGESGLLCVRSAFASGGWCELADRAVVDDAGRFRFEGRADRIVKIEGMRVSLPQLEQAIAGLKWVTDAAVAPVPPDRSFLGAVITLSAEGQDALARLGKFRFERLLRLELAATQEPATLPRRWRVVSEIPVDGMGKRRIGDLVLLLAAAP